MMPQKTAVELRGLTFRYPDYPSLPAATLFLEADLELLEGQVALLLGGPDSGKSTLCRIAAGLVPRFSGGLLDGEVMVNGRSVPGASPYELMLDVGLVFQNPAEQLFTPSCESEAAFALESLGVPSAQIERRVRGALRGLGILALRHRSPQTLSGGEKKKLALACLQALGPAVWVLDETFEELDEGTKRRLLQRLKSSGRTVLITSAKWYELFREGVDRFFLLSERRVREVHPGAASFRGLLRREGFLPEPRRSQGRRAFGWALEAEGLRYRYPGEGGFLLQVERLAIPLGGALAVVGDNGSGKTTLAKLLCGLLAPERGSVRVRQGAQPQLAEGQALSRLVAYIFQDPDLQIFLPTVGDELSYGLKLQGLAPAEVASRVAPVPGLFKLPGLASPPALLSYGARKRLQAAVYHLLGKRIVIFDEGDSGLGAAEFSRLIRLFRRQDRGLLVITHDLGLAAAVTDQTVRIVKGRIG
jgi:energy-coupling factor transporter ATP-binding protein EcfA2